MPRPDRDVPQPGIRSRPHVHGGVLDGGVDSPPRRHDRAPRLGASRAGAPPGIRAADGGHVDLASRGRARSGGTRGALQPTRASPLRHGDHGAAGEGGAPNGNRTPTRRGPARRVAVGSSAHRRSAVGNDDVERRRGPSSPRGTSGRSCSWRPGCTRRREPSCSCSRPGRGCRRTLARRWGSLDSFAASGCTARVAWRGWRTTLRPSPRRRSCRRRSVSNVASDSSTCRSRIRHRPASPRGRHDRSPGRFRRRGGGREQGGKSTLVKLLARCAGRIEGRS